MSEGVEVWRGSVATWECDAMGHLNVGFYVAKSMEGLASLAAELGMAGAFAADARATLTVREQHIRFLREARPGMPLAMTGGVIEIGESQARLIFLLRHADGQLAASFQTLVDHVTARDARAFPWPARVLARAQALRLPVPPEAAPRSLGLEPVESRASLARANELGLRRTGLGAVRPGDCDLFGRMRTELMMARISDGIPHFLQGRSLNGEPPGQRAGGAALEYRLIHLDWPRAGDRVELRSGASGGDARFRKLTHWLLDPDSGRAWGAAQAIAVSFDLETRKIITLSDEALAAADAQVIPGLTL
ncbi:thioesterase family protein [Phenylobacterium sp.]|uniref:thioesterase family protein n=1 Tax=Phenylobacterium sp. TaxID=1871053 RepID=UPI002C47E2FA|nr:thioesterase family protein [Phenylobacterium sp.]HLZ74368.1 thioesterase family protein [Phenylobacterium sp.]